MNRCGVEVYFFLERCLPTLDFLKNILKTEPVSVAIDWDDL